MVLRVLRDLSARFESSRLSTKILILSVFTTLLPLVLLTSLFDRANTQNGRQLLLTELQQQSDQQASELEERMQSWQRIAAHAGSDPIARGYMTAPDQYSGAATYLQQSSMRLDPDFRAVHFVDNSGRILLSTDPASYTQAALTPARMQRLAPPGQTGVSDPIAGEGLPASSLVFAPITDSGAVLGRVVITADASRLAGFANPTRLGPDRFAMLIDGNGVVIGYNGPSPQQVLYHVVDSGDQQTLNQLRASGVYGAEPLAPLGMTGWPGQLTGGPSQGNAQVHFPPIDRAVELGYSRLAGRPWRVAVMQDELAFLAPLRSSTFTSVLYFLAAVVPIALLLYIVVRFLERTERQSLHDDLTGLPNRRFFHDLMERQFRRAERTHRPLSVINIDLDRFKVINDEHGHAFGDEVLKSFAGLLSRHVRSIDMPVRYGGEEFVVLLPDTDKEGATRAADKIRRAMQDLRLGRRSTGSEARRGTVGDLTISAGVAAYPDDGDSAEVILQRADQAMYLAKSLGRNRVIAFGSAEPLTGLADDVDRLDIVISSANRATVEALSAAIDARDEYTHGHSRRVAAYAELVAREMGMTTSETDTLELGALLHDVGTIAVARHGGEAGGLTEDERQKMETHPTIGHRLVSRVPFLEPAAPIILHHHENFDGTGYPGGIAGEEIPLAARIIKVADAFDSMTTVRAHRDARPVEWALGELRRNSGTQFDPEVVKALVAIHGRHRLRPAMSHVSALAG